MAEQEGAAYDLGVSMGILSYHVTAGNLDESVEAAQTAASEASRVENSGIQIAVNALNEVVTRLNFFRQNFNASQDLDASMQFEETYAPTVVNLRGQYQGEISAGSQTGGQGYATGTAMGIAEGQATDGDPARSIVFDQLGVAIAPAQSLALDTTPLVNIRNELSQDGSMQDILQQITYQRGLYSAQLEAGRYAPTSQAGWQYCSKCAGLVYGQDAGSCPAAGGGAHTTDGSWNYTLLANDPAEAGQHDWKYCSKCQGLFFAQTTDGTCPADHGEHNGTNSYDYILSGGGDGQPDWRWCTNCQGLFFAGTAETAGVCPGPVGGPHDGSGSGGTGYTLQYST